MKMEVKKRSGYVGGESVDGVCLPILVSWVLSASDCLLFLYKKGIDVVLLLYLVYSNKDEK